MTTGLENNDIKTESPPAEKWVVANRTDGLGARLMAVVNGLWMASSLGVPFKLEWKERPERNAQFHAVVSAKRMFSPEFMERYGVASKLNPADFAPINPKMLSMEELKAQLALPKLQGLLAGNVDYQPSWGTYSGDEVTSRARAFSMIDFHPSVVSYMEQARAVPLPDRPVAIHLRAGDIIYGVHRKKGYFTDKVISLPIAKRIVELLRAEGHSIVVYGQDQDALRYFKDQYGTTLANEVTPAVSLESHEEAIFEITTMSRCEKIVAGESNFAVLACWMAGIQKLGPEDLFSNKEQAEIILADLAHNADVYPPLQTAFAYWSAFFWGYKDLDGALLEDALINAERYDPENGLYRITRFWTAVQRGQYVNAESLLRDGFGDEHLEGKVREVPLIVAMLIADYKNPKRYYYESRFAHVHKMAGLGLPYGAACSAVLNWMKGEQAAAIAALESAREAGLPDQWHQKLRESMLAD